MARLKGSKNKTPSKILLAERIAQIEQKGLPPSFGRIDALIIAPQSISNNPIELLKLNKGFVGTCNQKNSTSIASSSLRLFATKNSSNEKIVFPYKNLNIVDKDKIRSESKKQAIKMANDIVEISDHPVFEVLNNVNNGDLNYYDLMELTSAYLGMIGNAYWEIVEVNGLPTGINVLPAEYTTCILSDDMKVKGYRTFNGIYERNYIKENIIHFKNVSPGLFWRVWNNALVTGLYGMGDAEYVLDEIYLYNSINSFLRALTENNAIPNGLVKYTGGRLDKNTMQDVQAQWDKTMRTWKNAGKTKVMDSDFDFVPLSLPPKDLDFMEGRQWLRGVIANAFGVPEDLLTSSNSNRASSTTAIHQYLKYTILPKLKRIEERLNSHLLPKFDDNLFFTFDSPVPEDAAINLKKEESDLRSGVLTINEVRAKRGLEPVEWGNKPYSINLDIVEANAQNNQGQISDENTQTDNNKENLNGAGEGSRGAGTIEYGTGDKTENSNEDVDSINRPITEV
jgi:HK97 family phage portal protein